MGSERQPATWHQHPCRAVKIHSLRPLSNQDGEATISRPQLNMQAKPRADRSFQGSFGVIVEMPPPIGGQKKR